MMRINAVVASLLALSISFAALTFALTAESPNVFAELPASGHCSKALWPNNSTSLNLPLPVWICHLGMNAVETEDTQTVPPQPADYQLLADALLQSVLPAQALALHKHEPRPQEVVALLGLSPVFGCELKFQAATTTEQAQFLDACTSSRWDMAGEPLKTGLGQPAKPLLRFPYRLLLPPQGLQQKPQKESQQSQQLQLGVLGPEVPFTDISFVPDATNTKLPVFERLLKALLWGRLTDVQTLWPELPNQGLLTEPEQARLFINAAAKEHLHLLDYLKARGLNPGAKTEMGSSLQSVAQMMQSDKVLNWLNHESR